MVVTAKDFRANQSRYIGYAHNGEDVILKSRAGSVRLVPVDKSKTEDIITFDRQEEQLIKAAHNMTAADIEHIRQKDEMSIEESQMLLLRMVEEEYRRL